MNGAPPPVRTTASRVRQGRWGRHMVWVLAGSLILASLVLLIVWAVRWGDFNRAQPKSAVTKGEAAGFHAPQRSGG